MKKPSAIDFSYDLSVTYLHHLLQISEHWGISEVQLLAGNELGRGILDQPNARISTRKIGQITRRLMRFSGRSDIGMEYGFLIRPTTHGLLGYATMSCSTMADAMQVLRVYMNQFIKDFSQTVEIKGDDVIVTIAERYSFGSMRQVFFEAFLVTVCQQAPLLLGRSLTEMEIFVDWAKPAYFDAYATRLPKWNFKQAHIQIRFPQAYLSLPLVMADPHALKQAVVNMEREVADSALVNAPNIVLRVRAMLQAGVDGYPDVGEVAEKLRMSERTLKRRLKESGSTFQAQLDEARRRRAIELISTGKLSLQQVAQRLGFTDPAAFTRAFKRWTGERPSDFRNHLASNN